MSITNLLFILIVSFIQNAAFTWVSRSRNSGDPKKHAIAAVFSNGVWFVCNFFLLFPEMMKAIESGDWVHKITLGVVYTVGTVVGSVVMMKINLGHFGYIPLLTERGKSKVGAD
jgi:hypothetical protein